LIPSFSLNDLSRTNGAQKGIQREGETFLVQPVKQSIPFATNRHEVRGVENGEMPGDGRAGNAEPRRDVTGGEFSFPELLENLPARGVGQGSEHFRSSLHGCLFSYIAKYMSMNFSEGS
jgi:hypothetical protein